MALVKKTRVRELLFSANIFPLILVLTMLGILFVLFRMKGVETDYKIASLNKNIEKVVLENKELKAKRAKLMSAGKLKNFAKKYDLQQPRQKQIIVIP